MRVNIRGRGNWYFGKTISEAKNGYDSAKLQWDEVQTAIQQVQNIINRCLTIHDRLEASLRDLSRTGDVRACKATRKAADSSLKELSKELKPLVAFLHSSPQAAQILPKVKELVVKERELQEKLMSKHSTVVDSYEKKTGGGCTMGRFAGCWEGGGSQLMREARQLNWLRSGGRSRQGCRPPEDEEYQDL